MSKYRITLDGRVFELEVELIDGTEIAQTKETRPAPEAVKAPTPEKTSAPQTPAAPRVSAPAGKNSVSSPMPGTILKILFSEGEKVRKGQPVLVLEAMKMENEIVSPGDGVVSVLYVKEGDSVQGGAALFEIGE